MAKGKRWMIVWIVVAVIVVAGLRIYTKTRIQPEKGSRNGLYNWSPIETEEASRRNDNQIIENGD